VIALSLHDWHAARNARFDQLGGREIVTCYSDVLSEYTALRHTAGVLDLSFRGGLCLTGADRQQFLHGQVTNNVRDLHAGEGCYAALVTAKGKLVGDLQVYCLADELLLDFEPGLAAGIVQRLQNYIVAEEVQIVDVSDGYGLVSVQGPQAAAVLQTACGAPALPAGKLDALHLPQENWGELLIVNHPRGTSAGFDLFAPVHACQNLVEELSHAAAALGGRLCGWNALETVRIEAGLPRFGADMDETTLAPEAGIEDRAISYSKGCYIGQEVIARIRTYGQVARALRGLRCLSEPAVCPVKGDKLVHNDKEVGQVTSFVFSPALQAYIGLGYVRREVNQIGTRLALHTAGDEIAVEIVPLPFVRT
jgi:folate-binding protein YgfZ